jgi:hypothetical protein
MLKQEHGGQQKRDQGGENARAHDGQLLDVADEAGAARQPGQFGEVDKDESKHHDAVEDALDDDGGQ